MRWLSLSEAVPMTGFRTCDGCVLSLYRSLDSFTLCIHHRMTASAALCEL